MQETLVQFLCREDPLEKGKATLSSVLAGGFHGLHSPWGCKESDMTERLWLSSLLKWGAVAVRKTHSWVVTLQDARSVILLNYLVFLNFYNMGGGKWQLHQVLWGLEVTCIKCLVQCIIHCKCLIQKTSPYPSNGSASPMNLALSSLWIHGLTIPFA